MKTLNIIIPSDFALSSLNIIPVLAERYPKQKLNISLVHFLQLSDSISDLLLLSRRSREYQLISDEFYAGCTMLKNDYEDQIENITPDFFYGNTVAVFKNYLEERETDLIAMPENHNYARLTPNSFDPSILMQRSGYKIVTLKAEVKQSLTVVKAEVEHELLEV
ncbi:hypothetical protein SAMN05192574_10631 [Mucilaginibacter gossypiicola]|uniref:Universal stress protein family protein n=1 Tax=Mucilaginibacter gossypiicola TaxID=551995 RepID=A0A1H8MQR1_9SPHI|nr:hypothetical protein [Mucilaginibacter gossypiicola]SEO19573.1 hypothetical protein SAMN05192574_10631 [Mucilaginibacter gossypiicola]